MKRLLLLEDDGDIAGLIKQFIHPHIEIIWVENGQKGLAAISNGPKFDLIITDYNMPIMDGIEFLNELRRFDKKTPAFLYTGNPAQAEMKINPEFVEFIIAKDNIVKLITESERLLEN